MGGINLSEECHIVNYIEPADNNAGVVGPVLDMSEWDHVTFITTFGVTDANPNDIIIEACDNMTPTTHPDMIFHYYIEVTDAGDVLDTGPTAVVAATGVDHTVITGANNVMVVVEINGADLPSGYRGVRYNLVAGAGNTFSSVVAILSGGRYKGYASPTVLT